MRQSLEKELPLKNIACPRCGHQQDPRGLKLITKAGFSNLQCQKCDQKTSSSLWRCRCMKQWPKCGIHVHEQKTTMNSANINRVRQQKGQRPKVDIRGRDVPMPRTRVLKAKGSVSNMHESYDNRNRSHLYLNNEIRIAVSKFSLRPGTRLAAKFPHLVQAASPT